MLAGLDVGTTGSKIVVYNDDGKFIEKFYASYKTTRVNNSAEINPNELIFAIKDLVKKASCKYDIEAIGVDTFGEAFVMLDNNDKPLFNILVSCDDRGQKELDECIKKVGKKRIESITKLAPHIIYSLPKIMWFKNNKPSLFKKCSKILLMEDFVIYCLTGNRIIDYSLAARTMAFDVDNLVFSKEILDKVGLDIKLFSTPKRAGSNCGFINDKVRKELGIAKKISISCAGHDQIAVSLGAGALNESIGIDGAGTTECLTTVCGKGTKENILINSTCAISPYVKDDLFVTFGFIFTSGALVDWFVENFCKSYGKNVFNELEKDFKEGPTGLLLLPHFTGAASPYMDSESRGAIVGLTLENTISDIYKSVLEGVAYETRIIIEKMRKSGIKLTKLVATGGGANSKNWLQIKADIFNLPIEILPDNESGTLGSAILAGVAIGKFKSVDDAVNKIITYKDRIVPNLENHRKYNACFKRYQKLYQSVKGVL